MSFFKKTKPEEKREQKPEVTPIEERKKQSEKTVKPPPPPPPMPPKVEQQPKEEKGKSQNRSFLNRFQSSTPEQKETPPQQFSTRIGKTITVTGEISGGEDVLVEGKVNGDIFIMSKLSIGISGEVNGKIEAQEVRISGKSTGEVVARQKLNIASTGDVDGSLKTPRIIVEEGARLKSLIMTEKKAPKKIDIVKLTELPDDKKKAKDEKKEENKEETTQKLKKDEKSETENKTDKETEQKSAPRTIDTSQYIPGKNVQTDSGKGADKKKK